MGRVVRQLIGFYDDQSALILLSNLFALLFLSLGKALDFVHAHCEGEGATVTKK